MNPFDKIFSYIFPAKCISCGESLPIKIRNALCKNCLLKLENAKRILPIDTKDPNVRSCFCLFYYSDETVKKIIFNMKYKGNRRLCEYLADRMYENIKFRGLSNIVDIVTFAPRRKIEKRRTGHDQAQLLAKDLASNMNVLYENLVERKGISKKQRSLKGKERYENVKGKFVCNRELEGKRILLIDDVITTGSTVSECARELKKAGADKIYIMGIAH